MDAMVTARVPIEIKRQADARLKEMGSSTTELINAAYRYVLAQGQLPIPKEAAVPDEPQVKTLAGEAAREFVTIWQTRSVLEPRDYDGANFKELLDKARSDYYARLA